jgi:hypothetical protein
MQEFANLILGEDEKSPPAEQLTLDIADGKLDVIATDHLKSPRDYTYSIVTFA